MTIFGTAIAHAIKQMDGKILVLAFILFGVQSFANTSATIVHFTKTFTYKNVEVIQMPSKLPFYATAKVKNNKKQILLVGDYKNINDDVLSLVMCHELGHMEDQYPRRPAAFDASDEDESYSSEGAADYYTTYRCLKILWPNAGPQRSIDTSLRFLNISPWPVVSVDTPDLSVVDKTMDSTFPSRQCRLDTFVAGALNKPRPACWYKEVEYPLESICYSYGYQIDPPREPTGVPSCRVVGETMYIDGLIDSNLLFELKALFPNVKKLELNSPGGEIADVYNTAEYVRQKGIFTNVRNGAICSSACTLVYMAGTHRTAHPNAKFLFHGIRNGKDNFDEYYADLCQDKGQKACIQEVKEISKSFYTGTADLFKKYVQLGASEELWIMYQKFPEDPDWFKHANFFKKKDWIMTVEEAMRLNIVQEYSDY